MIRMMGMDHSLAPVNVRSVFTFRKQEKIDAMAELKEALHADGVLILATCNRMEIWADMEDDADQILPVICRIKEVDPEEYRPYFRGREDEDAVRHLFFTCCGLKSAIVAEDQILGQVKEALGFARLNYFTNNVLEVLFRDAVAAAKKVKTEVHFTHANGSAISQAISLLKSQNYDFEGKECMVIGNGEYGKLAAESLMQAGAHVTVTLRQYHSGVVLVPDGCDHILYGDKMELFPHCDLVVSATTSPNYTVYYDKVAPLKPDHDIILIDFAVPRDIEPEIRNLPGYTLYDIDDFKTTEIAENKEAYIQAEQIIDEKIGDFLTWASYRDLIPHIQHISRDAALDLHGRIEKSIRGLRVSDDDKKGLFSQIELSSGKVVSKILFILRDSLDEASFRQCVSAIETEMHAGVEHA